MIENDFMLFLSQQSLYDDKKCASVHKTQV